MKTQDEINIARIRLYDVWQAGQLGPQQRNVLAGMTTALAWVMDNSNGSSLQRLLDGEPIAPGASIL